MISFGPSHNNAPGEESGDVRSVCESVCSDGSIATVQAGTSAARPQMDIVCVLDVTHSLNLGHRKKELEEVRNASELVNAHLHHIHAYKHPEYRGPLLGPRPAEENRREFSEDVLRAGQSVIGLQAGTNKVASQSGQSFGASRKIILGK